jgi:hypothetical protein
MVVFFNEKIKVGAVFKNGNVFPKWFQYHSKKITVKEITYSWKRKNGENRLIYFSVSDGVNLYELSFHPDNLLWNLEACE